MRPGGLLFGMYYNMKDDKLVWPEPPVCDEDTKLMQELRIYKAIVEVLQNNKDEFLWEPCDCGCPSKSTARSKAAVDIIRLLKALEEPTEPTKRKEWKLPNYDKYRF